MTKGPTGRADMATTTCLRKATGASIPGDANGRASHDCWGGNGGLEGCTEPEEVQANLSRWAHPVPLDMARSCGPSCNKTAFAVLIVHEEQCLSEHVLLSMHSSAVISAVLEF